MTTITVSLSEAHLQQLQEKAARLRLTPEELVRVSIEEALARPDEQFGKALERVLNKNSELYRRLA